MFTNTAQKNNRKSYSDPGFKNALKRRNSTVKQSNSFNSGNIQIFCHKKNDAINSSLANQTNMYPNQNQQQNEDDDNRKIRPVRRGGPNIGRNPRMPHPENVLTPSPSSEGAPEFR